MRSSAPPSHRMVRAGIALGALLALPAAPVGAQAPDPPGALPYDVGFDRQQFPWSMALAATPDGGRVAYTVRRIPADRDLGARYLPNGTPTSAVGSRIVITDGAGRSVDLCPGGNCWRPVWSPDGRRLAFYSDRDGPPQLWVHDLAAGRSRRVSDAPVKAKLWTGDEPRWSPDGSTIYLPLAPAGAYRSPALPSAVPAAPDAAGVTVLRSGSETDSATAADAGFAPMIEHFLRENLADLAAVDLGSGRHRVLAPATGEPKPSVLRLSGSGRWIGLLSVFKGQGVTSQQSSHDLAVVSASGGPVHVVGRDIPVLNDYFGLAYAWHPTEDRLVYFKDGALWLVDLSSGAPSEPTRLGEALDNLAPTVHWFTRDGRAVVVGTDPVRDQGYGDPLPRGIALVPLDGGRPTRITIDPDRWSFLSIVKADERTVWQPDGRSVTLLLKANATGRTAAVRFDPASGAGTVLWEGLARIGHLTGGGQHQWLVGTYEDLATPPDVYRFSADFSERARVSTIEPRLERVAMGTGELFETTVPLYDGRLGTVRTAVLLPPGAKRGDRLPAVVLMYPGGDVTRAAETFGGGGTLTVPTALFTSRGYAVVLANLTLGPNGEAGNPAREMLDVLLPQVYRAAELGYVDLERLAIGGQSFGGYGTATILSRTNLFRAAVAVSGIYDLGGTYGHLDPAGNPFWIGWAEGGQARMGTHPWANLPRYIDNSPYYQADKVFTPILIVHGDADFAFHDGVKLFSALRRLGRPAQLARYAGQGHVISEWKRASAVDAAERIVAFVRAHLGPGRRGPTETGANR